MLTGGTDNHLIQIDVTPFNLTGRQAEALLREAGMTLNKNTIPFDPNGPWYTSGLRVGTPALTTLGMGAGEMCEIGTIMGDVLTQARPLKFTRGKSAGQFSKIKYKVKDGVLENAQKKIATLLARFPLYPELDLAYLQEAFGKR